MGEPNKWKWLYENDYPTRAQLYTECAHWHSLGYRVFIQGYSTGNCREYKP